MRIIAVIEDDQNIQEILVVLDQDFSSADPLAIVQKIVNRIQQLPAVPHCIRGSDALDTGWAAENLVQVEKQGDSSEFLKETIRNIPSGSTPPPPARHRLD